MFIFKTYGLFAASFAVLVASGPFEAEMKAERARIEAEVKERLAFNQQKQIGEGIAANEKILASLKD